MSAFYVIVALALLSVLVFIQVRFRHGSAWHVLAGAACGLALVVPMALAASWAGLDLGRLDLLLTAAISVALIAGAVVAGNVIRRRRGRSPSKSSFDLT